MFYAIFVPQNCDLPERPPNESLIFDDIKDAKGALKRFAGSRMKTFSTFEKALSFLNEPEQDESFIELDSSYSQDLLVNSLEKLSIQPQSNPRTSAPGSMGPPSSPLTPSNRPGAPAEVSAAASPTQQQAQATPATTTTPAPDEAEPAYPTPKPGLLAQLRRKIESGDYEAVEETIWSNPKYLVSPCDSIINLMAGPKYNACHIAAKANKPEIMALLLDTMSNFSFLRKLYPRESDENLQDRVNHLLDSYLNTPDRLQGNTPLHFACKLGHYRVVRVLLTFEGCDLGLRDTEGKTAEESVCSKYVAPPVANSQGHSNKKDLENEDHSQNVANTETDGDNTTLNNTSLGLNGSIIACDNEASIRSKIKSMFKHQLHLPLFRDQLKKRLTLEKRRSRANSGSQLDSDTSYSDIDNSFILNSPIKSQQH